MPRAAAMILSGTAATAALSLARNLLVARLVPLEDYGIAATLIVVLSVVEMTSALGLQQQIVQDRQGDDPRLQAALQGFNVLRGALLAAILWLLADTVARFFGAGNAAASAYRWLALVPLLSGFSHFDMHRLHRHRRFGPLLLSGIVPAALSVLLVWPLALWTVDHRAMLWAMIAQTLCQVLASHLLAERRYRLALRWPTIRASLGFGWPILLNGLLLFAVFNGDRLIVGHLAGMEALAVFSLALTLALAPALVLEKSAQMYFLPQLAAAVADRPRFVQLSIRAFQMHLVAGVLLVAGVTLLGPPVLHWALGARHEAAVALLPLLAVQQALRLAKNGNSPAALATGQTGVSLMVSLPRVLCLCLALAVAMAGGGLVAIVLTGVLGEALGYALSLLLTRQRLHLPLRPLGGPTALLAASLLVAGWGESLGPTVQSVLLLGLACAICAVIAPALPLRWRGPA